MKENSTAAWSVDTDGSIAKQLHLLADAPLLTHHAAQLKRLAADIRDRDRASIWAELDLNSVFRPDERALAEEPSTRGLRIAELARGILIFLPLLITWFGIALATRAYAAALDSSPELSGEAFIALWERGFDGVGTFSMPLSTVALLDVIAISGLIVAAVYLQIERTRVENRQVDHFQAVRNQLSEVLLQVSLAVVPAKLSSPERFQSELTDAAASMHGLLSSIGESAAAAAGAAASIGGASAEMERVSTALGEAATATQAASGAVNDSLETLVGPATSLQQAMVDLVTATEEQRTTLASVAAALEQTLGDLQSASATANTRSVQLASRLDDSLRAHQGYVGELTQGQSDQRVLTAAVTLAASKLADLNEHVTSVAASTVAASKGALAASQQFAAEIDRTKAGADLLTEAQTDFADLLRRSNASAEIGVNRLRSDLEQLHQVLRWLTDLSGSN